MRMGTNIFRVLLALGWALLIYVSVQAVRQMGFGAAGEVFLGDLGHPWRAQFNTDFGLHLLLVAAWMVYRSRPWFVGLICGLLAINLGGVFTLAYLLAVSIRAQGDMRKVLLGWRAEAPVKGEA
ncbi:MAG: hypothetical protein JWQ97_1033 [Phenylobacterium sp.]|nr:hypothetical protein [Phenylobacterium sp.]